MCIFRKIHEATVTRTNGKALFAIFSHEGKKIEIRILREKFSGLDNVRERDMVRLKVTKRGGEIVPKKVWLPTKKVGNSNSNKMRYRNNSQLAMS